MRSFLIPAPLPVPGAWPEGLVQRPTADLRRVAAKSQSIEACAHYWWRRFLAAGTAKDAYAAWVLFCGAADRRAWVWIQSEIDAVESDDPFFAKKMFQVELNRSNLERAMNRRDNFREKFLTRDTFEGIWRWAM